MEKTHKTKLQQNMDLYGLISPVIWGPRTSNLFQSVSYPVSFKYMCRYRYIATVKVPESPDLENVAWPTPLQI